MIFRGRVRRVSDGCNARHTRTWASLSLLGCAVLACCGLTATGQRRAGRTSFPALPDAQTVTTDSSQPNSELRQQLDVEKHSLAQIPANPRVQPDPFRKTFDPIDSLTDRTFHVTGLKLRATYTFVNQYASTTPDSVRHNQAVGRFDSPQLGAHTNTLNLPARSGYWFDRKPISVSANNSISATSWDLASRSIAQGGGAEQPIRVNALYWRQDLIGRRVSLYVGKVHPNQFIALSMFNDNETSQFLNGANDGNAAIPYNGTYAGGAALEVQATRHLYIHAVTVDTEGSAQSNLARLSSKQSREAQRSQVYGGSRARMVRRLTRRKVSGVSSRVLAR